MGMEPLSITGSVTAKHIFTHAEWHMIGYAADVTDESSDFVWASADEIRTAYAIPTALKKYAEQMK
jgi:A/G-specific adenine glycosylase